MISTPKTPTDRVVSFLDKKGKLELATGMVGLRGLLFSQKQQEKQQSAEDSFVRRKLWGESPETKEAEDVGGHTILGDIVQQPPVIVTGQQSSGFGQLLGAALAGASLLGIPGAGVAAYLYGKSQQAEAPKPETTIIEKSEDLGLGLLKFEDLKTP
jgi:hypothetical protein